MSQDNLPKAVFFDTSVEGLRQSIETTRNREYQRLIKNYHYDKGELVPYTVMDKTN